MPNKVKVYSTSTCPHCIRLKSYLSDNKIKFENYDVGEDQEKADEMIKKTDQMGVPVIDIDGKIIIGFDKAAIAKELGL